MKAKIIAAVLIVLFAASACVENAPLEGNIEIHDIQGCSHTSPLEGKIVRNVQGVVTKKYSSGFVMQSDRPDMLDCSSEAIFVHTNNYEDVITGERVGVNGTVAEFFPGTPDQNNLSQTEITNAEARVIKGEITTITPLELGKKGRQFPVKVIEDDQMNLFDPESDGLDFYESMEWMLVRLPEMVVVGPRNVYNEIVVSEGVNAPELVSSPAESVASIITNADHQPGRIMIVLPTDWTQNVNIGDRVNGGAEGVMIYSYENYKVEPTNNILVENVETTTKEFYCPQVSDKLRVANYNIHNFSQYISTSKIKTLVSHIVADLCSPDLVVLEEVEDDSGERDDGVISAKENLSLLITKIISAKGPEYELYDFASTNNSTGGVSGGNIRTMFLVRKDSKLRLESSAGDLTENGIVKIEDKGKVSLFPNPMMIGYDDRNFDNSRKPIIGLFSYEGKQIIVIGVHFISKAANSPDYGRIQPPSEPELQLRLAQAAYVNRWADRIMKKSPGTIILVAGDMNDGYDSEVLKTIQGSLFIDSAAGIPAYSRFSLIMDGGASLFDHILVSKNVEQYNAEILHLNTLFDESKQSSDHDPVVISLVSPK